ncbi:kit ligand a isoform X5 [Alosa alosa]|uniref:kit ligand a isoform X1 n=1 Tax=Alosa sapidissima TaxID=34773 RepID=UPI001C086354|nr:kit ligand a isoform X1 [Alosa sapidissima]XP_048112695.1 kit ligand a isoform X5 [Alosa alosa]
MKKSKIWMHTCFHLLLFIAVVAHSSEIGNPITDDIKKISILKQNIPKDYKITVKYIPMEESGLCWVRLNVFHLEESLKVLARKFGNISSNRDHINTFIQILREMRYHIGNVLDDTMLEFQCHYREEKWPTGDYFDFVEYFFKMANSSREDEDCESPPCPTLEGTTTTSYTTKAGSVSPPSAGTGQLKDKEKIPWVLPENIEKSLLSLLLIPVIAILLLFAWKIKSRRHVALTDKKASSHDVTKGVDGSSPQLETEALEEKKCLNVIEITEEV